MLLFEQLSIDCFFFPNSAVTYIGMYIHISNYSILNYFVGAHFLR